MNILFLAQHYAPEDVSGAVLATELATDLTKQGHKVTFVTCAPNYPNGIVYPSHRNRLIQCEIINGVKIIRTWSYISEDKTFWKRMLNYGTWSASALLGGFWASKPDIIFSYSPPLPLGLSAWLLSRIWNVPWVLRVEDLYPDAAIAAGVLNNSFSIRFFTWIEKVLYRKADQISLISEGFRHNLLRKGISPSKLSVTPVWADPDIVHPLPKYNSFRQKHMLDGTFVVMYAGALGHTSVIEDVLDVATILQGTTNIESHKHPIRFVIVGEGVKKKRLIHNARQRGLNNILFLPFQPRELFSEMLAAADLSLVTLNTHSSNFSLPSKTFNIMASARPILAITPSESEIASLLTKAKCGINFSPGQPQQVADAILNLQSNQTEIHKMGLNGRAVLVSQFSRARCVESFRQLLVQTINERNRFNGAKT